MKKLESAPQDNIVNEASWTKEQHLSYFQNRLSAMRSKKNPYTKKFTQYAKQVVAESFYDNYGELQVVPPLEQNLIEVYVGRTNGKVVYDIVPDGQTDIEQLQPAKYALNFFLDGNDKDNFWKENKDFRMNKATYGTGIFFTGMRSYKDIRFAVKDGVELQGGSDMQNENNFDKITNETWFFFPKSIHPNNFYIDDGSVGNPNLQEAEDCIYKEKVSYKQFELMFGDNDAVDKEVYNSITTGVDIDEKNVNDSSVHQEEIILYYYYNRVTKSFYIVANEDKMLLQSIYLYEDGKLPFTSAQHYPDNNCFWGIGIPRKIGYLKIYKGDILQDILSGAAMNNSVNFLTQGDSQVGQDWNVGGRGLNIWRTTGGVEQTQKMDTSINLGYFTAILQIIDDLVVQDTGDDIRQQANTQSDKVGIEEIREANKAVRRSAVDESYNIALDEALTMTLSRIKTFAPSLLCERIMSEDGKTEVKKIFPKITIKDATVKQDKKGIVVTEDLGKYGYFEMKPGIVEGLGVKIQTSSTNSMLPILERQKFTEMTNNWVSMGNMAQFIPGMAEKMAESFDVQDYMDSMRDAYQIGDKLKAHSKKDKIRDKNKAKMKAMKDKLSLPLRQSNDTQNQAPTPQDPSVGHPSGGLPKAEGAAGGIVSALSKPGV